MKKRAASDLSLILYRTYVKPDDSAIEPGFSTTFMDEDCLYLTTVLYWEQQGFTPEID
ncbi:MAG: hypothetical protein AAF327_17845 [Cyanobacteria bacterium P01_A01_bin.37]